MPTPRLHRLRRTLAATAAGLALALAGIGLAQTHVADVPESAFHALDYAFEGPTSFETGLRRVTLENRGVEPHHLQFARLNDDVDMATFGEALQSEGLGALTLVTLAGGPGLIPPGATTDTLVDFTDPGTYALLCFIENADGVPHVALGMVDALEVTGEATSAAEVEADVEVRMFDFAYTMPDVVPAGRTLWKVVNDGPQPHEMIVLRLEDGADFDGLTAHLRENGEHGMPATPIGGAQGLGDDLTSYLEWDLAPGDYVAICFIPDPKSGAPHFALGMAAPFEVEAN